MDRARALACWTLLVSCSAACGRGGPAVLTFSGSALGAEADIVRTQLDRFAAQHPGVRTELQITPDAAGERHQLYVQWLNGRASEPDVLQLDIVWTAEFAAAGWILPLDRFEPDVDDFFPAAIAADRWRGSLYALPWFVDVGLLYWRTDLIDARPRSLPELRLAARRAIDSGAVPFGLATQAARYEGLVAAFVEVLSAFGGRILDDRGRVTVDGPEAVNALTFMRDAIDEGIVPASALTWQEEQARLAFENGQSAFMRNWPYAWSRLQDRERSRIAGRFQAGALPGPTPDSAAAALGGAQLAVNAHTADPALAWALVEFLTAPEQMLERARVAAQFPARRSLYETKALADALPISIDVLRDALAAATSRPVTPVYSELSEILQVRLHRALTGQQTPGDALRDAAREIRTLLTRTGLATESGE